MKLLQNSIMNTVKDKIKLSYAIFLIYSFWSISKHDKHSIYRLLILFSQILSTKTISFLMQSLQEKT